MKLKCDCCGFEEELISEEVAFHAGWDAPPHFTGYVACPLCPAMYVVLGRSHAVTHERWARDGRPTKFSQEDCVEPEHRVPEALLRKMQGAESVILTILIVPVGDE